MTFFYPAGLLWALLAIPIVGLYLLKIRQRRVTVATIIFWQQIFEQKRPRSLFQKLRHPLSLLMQLLLLALLVLALGQPFFNWQFLQPTQYVLIIDNSASMNATDVSPTRLARAKRQAQRLVDRLRFFDSMAVISAGTSPQIASGLTGHQRTLRRAVASIAPTDGPTRVMQAVETAKRLLAGQPHRRIVVFSDAAFDHAQRLLDAEDLRLVRIGERSGNVAITMFQVRRSLTDSTGYEILTRVANFGDEAVDCRLELDLDGQLLDLMPLSLAAGGTWTHVFEKTSHQGGALTAKIDRPDALATDNSAWAVLPPRRVQRVTLVSPGNVFLQKVFEAMPMVALRMVETLPDDVAGDEVIILDRQVPAPLPPGPVLVINPDKSSDLWQVHQPIQDPIVARQDAQSPLMAHVRLDNVYMPQARRLELADSAAQIAVLAETLHGRPLYAAIQRRGALGRLLVLPVNLEQGDLPLRTAFPIMMANALSWMTRGGGELRESVATGTVLAVDHAKVADRTHGTDDSPQPIEDSSAVLHDPAGKEHAVLVKQGQATIGPLDQAGIWTLHWDAQVGQEAAKARSVSSAYADQDPDQAHGDDQLRIAANLADERESDLRPPTNLTVNTDQTTGAVMARPPWFYLAVVACAFVLFEWFAYQRRWIT